MPPRRYAGRLFYGHAEHLDVAALIIREDEIAFSLASVTRAHGRWDAETGKTAKRQPDGSYLAKGVLASKKGVFAGSSWDIRFRINHEVAGHSVEVSGELHEAGQAFEFEGDLDGKPI